MTVKLTLEYDGTRFHGWAIQPGKRSVAAVLTDGLRIVTRTPDLQITVAGRTDRGVHARGQVVSYDGPLPSLRSLNAVLPRDMGVFEAVEVPAGFNARNDALSRSYEYRLDTRNTASSPFERGRALWWPHAADLEALQACAAALVGTHDFTAFTPSQGTHKRFKRTVHAAGWVREDPEHLVFEIEGQSFLRHMNRILVGTMLEVGAGRRSIDGFVSLLGGAPRSRAGVTAPASGLYLVAVRY